MKIEQQKATTVTSAKSEVDSGLDYTKSGPCTMKVAKQKTTGEFDIKLGRDVMASSDHSLDLDIQVSGTSSLESVPAIPIFRHSKSPLSCAKLKLQLYPIDELTRIKLEKDGHNPYLELTLGPQKKISSIVKHLNSKWGVLNAAGELMLFPCDARIENLNRCRRWTLKDSDVKTADVYVSMGRPAVFQLRYGWFSNLETKASATSLPSFHLEDINQRKENLKINAKDVSKFPFSVIQQEHRPARVDDSDNKVVLTPIVLDKTVQAPDNLRTGTREIWTDSLSNISMGALFSEASAIPDGNCPPLQNFSNFQQIPITCDSFDSAIAGYMSRYEAPNSSSHTSNFWDSEVTCQAFPIQKKSADQKTGTDPIRLRDMLNLNAEHKLYDDQKTSKYNLQLHTEGDVTPVRTDVCSHTQNNSRKRTIADMQHDSEGSHYEVSGLESGDIYKPGILHKFL